MRISGVIQCYFLFPETRNAFSALVPREPKCQVSKSGSLGTPNTLHDTASNPSRLVGLDELPELEGDLGFVGRQKRLRIGDEWFRVDLVFYHRRLRCLVLIDLKLGRFTHADAGQMHTYLNYALGHWTRQGENPPVGLILCPQRDEALARYALGNLPNKVLAAEYRTVLPDEALVANEVEKTRWMLEGREGI